MSRLAVVHGNGGHSRVVRSFIGARYDGIVIASDDGTSLSQKAVFEGHAYDDCDHLIAIGSNAARRRIFERCAERGLSLPPVVAPNAYVAPEAHLGLGVFVGAGACIVANAIVRDNAIVNTLSSVDHDCEVFPHAQIAVRVTICGTCTLGEESFVGAGATIVPGIRIGRNAVVGAQALVMKDVPDAVFVAGSPARFMRHV